jgi:hypothetical protein
MRRFTVPEINRSATNTAQIRLSRRSPHYWRVTLDHPPLNIFGPDTIPQLEKLITAIEADTDVRVVGEHWKGWMQADRGGRPLQAVPDILSYDPRHPASFPHNGRTLTDVSSTCSSLCSRTER